MLTDLGQQVYQDDFEKQFLEESSAFYKVGGAVLDASTFLPGQCAYDV